MTERRPELESLSRKDMLARICGQMDQVAARWLEAEATVRCWNEEVAPKRGYAPLPAIVRPPWLVALLSGETERAVAMYVARKEDDDPWPGVASPANPKRNGRPGDGRLFL